MRGPTLLEAILEPPRKVLHVAHPSGAGGLPADGLLSPLDCESGLSTQSRQTEASQERNWVHLLQVRFLGEGYPHPLQVHF